MNSFLKSSGWDVFEPFAGAGFRLGKNLALYGKLTLCAGEPRAATLDFAAETRASELQL